MLKKLFLLFLILGLRLDATSYFFAETGYRYDQVSSRATLSGDAFGSISATDRLRGINSWQLGGRGFWQVCSPWFLKGYAHYGWIFDGNYHEETFAGRLRGNTWDLSGGGGVLFCFNGFRAGPSVGWSFDELNLDARRVTSSILTDGVRTPVPTINSRQHIDGPWVGVDFFFNPRRCYELVFNYELHGGCWKGQRVFEGRDLDPRFGQLSGFSNRRHGNVWGNSFSLEAHRFGYCYSLGLVLKYQNFRSCGRGHFERVATPLSGLITRRRAHLSWHSFSAQLQLGYNF